MKTRLSYSKYQGFAELEHRKPGDRVVITSFGEVWIVDCDGGIGELTRYYCEVLNQKCELLVLLPQEPLWVVEAEYHAEDGVTEEITYGPFLLEKEAKDFHENLAVREDWVCGCFRKLEKP